MMTINFFKSKIFLLLISLLISIYVIFIPLGFSPDSLQYQYLLNNDANNIILNLLSNFSTDYQVINVIYSIMFLMIFSLSIYKYSKQYIFLSFILLLFLFYPNFGLIQIRSGVAIALFYFSIEYAKNRKFYKYLLINFIGVLFHSSSIIFIILYPYLRVKIAHWLLLILPFLGIICYKMDVFENIITNSLLLEIIPNFISNKLNSYIELLHYQDLEINHINLFSNSILLELTLYVFLNLILIKNEDVILFLKIFAFALFSWFFFSLIPVISQRLFNYFLISLIFIIPNIKLNIKKRYQKFTFIIIFLLSLLIIKQGISRYVFDTVLNWSKI